MKFSLASFFIPFFFLFMGLFSCSTLGLPSARSWSPARENQRGSAELGSIRVDKNTDWDSVEAETKRLLPLLLSEAGYKQNVQGQNTLVIDAVLIEREYMENWKTRRSLSAEIIIGKDGGNVAAGKAFLTGTKSLSSSKVLHSLLEAALSNALQALGGL